MDIELNNDREYCTDRFADFSQLLLDWENSLPGRGLPWAFESDPYRIWISEVMLQQTQAKTVVPFYLEFVDRFPKIEDLADASLDEVLRLWTGLGYYTRARNLHKAARQIKSQNNGEFPKNFEEVVALPGVGRSTAGAICALAYGMRTPILDGNAKRVYTRSFGVDDEKESQRIRNLWNIAEACTPDQNCQQYTQLIMDLGATVCTPKNPDCNLCPVSSKCWAYLNRATDRLPRKNARATRKNKSTTFVIVIDESLRLLLECRPPEGIWGGLWSFPEYGGNLDDLPQWFNQRYSVQIAVERELERFHHDFTHFRLNITPVLARVTDKKDKRFENFETEFIPTSTPLDRGVPAPVAELIQRLRIKELNLKS